MVPVSRRRLASRLGLSLCAAIAATSAHVAGQGPLVPGANVNMVRGTSFVGGDPYLQRQNEPSIAISTRNPCHLLAGSNDYRTVDFPDPTPLPNEQGVQPPTVQNPRDAWLGVFKSMDCGTTWSSSLLPGHAFDTSPQGTQSPNHGFTSAADPVVRAGTNGMFFYAGLVFDRADQSRSQIFVARFIDNNNKERGDTIQYIDAAAVDVGDADTFVDKPWVAVDQPRAGAAMCDINGQRFPAGRIYAAWARFEGGGARIMLSRSTDCGRTWQSQALSDTALTNQGASIAVAPHDGTVYVVWRQFGREGSPISSIQIAASRDGGVTFTRAAVASPINPFDQSKEVNRRFRSNTLPSVAADHLGRVYVAWAERGFARESGRTNPARLDPVTGDARIVVAVSSDFGRTFAPRFPIDDTLTDADGFARLGHQLMPSLTYTAGKLQAIYYDFSDDLAETFNPFVDESETPPVDPNNPNVRRRHTVDVRAAHADPGAQPRFIPVIVTPNGVSPRLSQYRSVVREDGTVAQVQFNPPNLPMFVGGSTPFIGDYIDVAGLSFVPFQSGWRHNNGTASGPAFNGAFPSLPLFHAVWTDHRDVKPPADGDWTVYHPPGDPFWKTPGSECVPSRAGMRNANVYTSRIGNGLYAGSPGNTKPLGFQRGEQGAVVVDPTTGRPVHMQRSFVVFVQNSLRTPKTYLLRIINQPGTAAGERASFLRAPQPPFSNADLATRPFVWLVATVPPLSTISRTVFVTSANERAMVRVDVLEVAPPAPTALTLGTLQQPSPTPLASGLRTTVLLNPDPTNPAILDADHANTTVPVLAEETHDPEIFDPVVTTIGDVKHTFIELRNPDEANPDEANPDEANIDEETPDEANPDEANPDEANPDEANPDEANPDEANIALANTTLTDEQLTNAHVVDVQWKVRNNGNTTTSYRFSPTFSGERVDKQFQLLVTKRYYVPAVDGITCDLGVRRTNQVLVNVSGFNPKNPDEANPDEANPDEANPDEANPDEANPDEANPDEANATFFLAPGETATATLRIYDLATAAVPPPAELAAFEETAAAVVQSQAPNTGEALPPRDAAGADLVATRALVAPTTVAAGGTAQVSWTLANRGTEPTRGVSFRTRFLLSVDRQISEGDLVLAETTFTGSVPADDSSTANVDEGELPQTTQITIPAGVVTASRFILVLTDALNEVPEADEQNNAADAQLGGTNALAFLDQPPAVTQGFRLSIPIRVGISGVGGVPTSPIVVPLVRLTVASGPAGATLGGTVLAPNVAGTATFADVTLSAPGTYTLLASPAGFEGPSPASPAVSTAFVVAVDDAPVANPDNYSVAANGVLDVREIVESFVVANDVDEIRSGPGVPPLGRLLNATLVTGGQFGAVQMNPTGGFIYAPGVDFNGVDSFTYQLNDGVSAGNVTTVRIAVGTGEGNASPFTRPLSLSVLEDSVSTAIDGLAAAVDPDGDPLSIVGAGSTHGQTLVEGRTLRYTPDPNYFGSDTIEYAISDGRGGVAQGIVNVTVTSVNDNPVARDDGPFTVPSNSPATSFDVLTNDDDGPDVGETLVVRGVGGAAHGVVSFTPTAVLYRPQLGYSGADSFAYEISDGNGGRASALVRINVGSGVNQTPNAVDDQFSTPEDTAISYGVIANDTDPDSHALVVTAVTQGDHGSVDFDNLLSPATVRYIPGPNFHGSDSFTYTAGDGHGGFDTATVTVTVTPVNDAPTALGDNAIAAPGVPTTLNLLANDTDPDVGPGATIEVFTPITSVDVTALGLINNPSVSGIAINEATGLVYAAGFGVVSVVQASSGSVVATIRTTITNPVFHAVDPATDLIYFAGNTGGYFAIDGRPTSPTFNQVVQQARVGSNQILKLVLDGPRHRLYLLNETSTPGVLTATSAWTSQQARVAVFDIDRASGTYGQQISSVVLPSGANLRDGALNPSNGKVYLGAVGTGSGIYVLDAVTSTVSRMGGFPAGTDAAIDIALDPTRGVGYGNSGSIVVAFDLATDTPIAGQIAALTHIGFFSGRTVVDPATGRLFVRSHGNNGAPAFVSILSPSGPTFGSLIADIPVGRDFNLLTDDLVIDAVSGRTFVTSGNDQVTVIDTAAAALLTTVNVGQSPGDVEFMTVAGQRRAYVDGADSIFSLPIANPFFYTGVVTGAQTGGLALSASGRVFVPITDVSSRIGIWNRTGFLGLAPGLPHSNGRYQVAASNPDPAVDQIYVLNVGARLDGTPGALPGFLTVLNGTTNSAIATYEIGNSPSLGLLVNRTSRKVYVPTGGLGAAFPGGMRVIDPIAGTNVAVNVGGLFNSTGTFRDMAVVEPLGKVYFRVNAIDPNGSQLASFTESALAASRLPSALGATGVNILRANNTTRRLYVGNRPASGANQVLVIDANTDALVATLPLGSPSVNIGAQSYIAIDEARSRVYISDFDNDLLHVVDATTHAVIATLHVGDGPSSVDFNPISNRIYVGNTNDNTLTFIDGNTLAVRGSLLVHVRPNFLRVDAVGQLVYIDPALAPSLNIVVVSDTGAFSNALTIDSTSTPAQGTAQINDDNTVTYTPGVGASGTDLFTYTITDGEASSLPATVQVTIQAALTITTTSLPSTQVGSAYSQTVLSNGTGPLVWSVTSGILPSGLALLGDGRLVGTATASGTFPFTVQVEDSARRTAARAFTLRVGPVSMPSTSLPNGLVGEPYGFQLISGGGVGAETWSFVSGTLPPGLTLSPSGLISGVPTTANNFSFTVTVTESSGSATGTLSIFVDGLPTLLTVARPSVLHESYDVAPYVATRTPATLELISGQLPAGLAISLNGTIAGTPQSTGRSTVRLRVTDARGRVDERDVIFDGTASDQSIGNAPVDQGTIQALTPTRRLAQTLIASTTGALSAIRINNGFCAAGSTATVEIRHVTGADVAVPDETGPSMGSGIVSSTSNIAALDALVPLRAGERYAVVVTSAGACEFRRVLATDVYFFGHALESVGGGPWQRIPGAFDLAVNALIEPASLEYFTTSLNSGASATFMPGRSEVLIASNNRIAQIFNTASGAMRRTTNDLASSRSDHTATLLDDGSVLIVGGRDSSTNTHPAATERLIGDSFEAAAPLIRGRELHTATKLPDGRVVIAGGSDSILTLSTVEIYSPAAGGSFSAGSPLLGPRRYHTATLLSCPAANPGCAWGGKILIAGGVRFNPAPSAELYDPNLGTSVATAGPMIDGRGFELASAKLADGRVLFVGGSTNNIGAEIYDPATNSFTAVANSEAFSLERHNVVALPDGGALVIGGRGQDQRERDFRLGIYRFNPTTNTFVGAGTLNTYRSDPTSTLLPDGRVLIAGGLTPNGSVSNRSFEFFNPDPGSNVGFTTMFLPEGEPGEVYPPTTILAAGGTSPYTFTLASGHMPPGLTFTNGTIMGTPTIRGLYTIVVRVTDGSPVPRTATMPFYVIIDEFSITTDTLPGATVGVPYSTQLTANGTGPWTWAITSGTLPAGFTFAANGTLSGTGTAASSTNLRFRVEDANGQIDFRSLTLDVTAELTITTTTLRDAVAPENYNVGLIAAGGNGRTWALDSGLLPHGMALTAGGTLSSAPLQTGDFPFVARVTDNFGRTTTQPLTLHVGAYDNQRFVNSSLPMTTLWPTAQTITVGATGTLYGIRADITCPGGSLFSITIQGVDAEGRPNDQTLMSDGPSPVPLAANYEPRPLSEVYVLPGRKHFPIGAKFAVRFQSASGCQIRESTDVGGGQAWIQPTSQWLPLADPPVSLALGTIIDPDTEFAFGNNFSSDARTSHLFCPPGGCAYPEQILVTANSRSLQLYEPATHRTTITPNLFDRFRSRHTSTRLADGRVLLAGGFQRLSTEATSIVRADAAIYDPLTRTVTPTGSLNVPRESHQAVLLADGRVVVAGGLGVPDVNNIRHGVPEIEIYNPATGVWIVVNSLLDNRWEHTLTLLTCPTPGCAWGGKVLIFGGFTDTWPLWQGELFDPAGSITAIGGVSDSGERARAEHSAVRLLDGRVFISGGRVSGYPGLFTSTDIYDPSRGANGTLDRGPNAPAPRWGHTSTLLDDGTVAIAGGNTDDSNTSTAVIDRFDPVMNTIEGAGSLGAVRHNHSAVKLANGRVAFVGGFSAMSRLQQNTIELWNPVGQFTITTTTLAEGRILDPYQESIDTRGGDFPITMEVIDGALPPGLALANSAGAIRVQGIPQAEGLFSFTVRAQEGSGVLAYRSLSIQIRPSLDMSGVVAPHPVVGSPVDEQLEAVGGNGTAFTWSVEPGFGDLPPGMTLTSGGRFFGTPTVPGQYTWIINLVDNGTPQQRLRRRVRWNVSTLDREQPTADPGLGEVLIDAGIRYVAQMFVPGRSGRLTSVRVNGYCSSGQLTTSLYDASTGVPSLPQNQITVNGSIEIWSPPYQWRTITFSDPPFVRAGRPYAIVVNSFNGTCRLLGTVGSAYQGGDAYETPFPAPGTWTPYQGTSFDLAFAAVVEPTDLSAFGTPTLDGRHSADEWSNASRVNMTFRAGDGERVPSTVFFQNDDQNLYMSVVFDRRRFEPFSSTDVYLDGDNDGNSFEPFEDSFHFNSSPTGFRFFSDAHQSHVACAPFTCWENDPNQGGTSDGVVKDGFIGESFTVEASHPIAGADAFDIRAVLGQTIGLRFQEQIWEPNDAQFVAFPQFHESPVPLTFAPQGGSCALPQPGLVAYWPGDSLTGTRDVHGEDQPGVLQGGATAGTATGRYGQAFGFNGAGSMLVADTNALSPHVGANGELTVEAWINMPALPADTPVAVIAKAGALGSEYMLQIASDGRALFTIMQPDGVHGSTAGGTIVPGQWHHVAGTFKGGRSVRLYVDGVLVDEDVSLVGTPTNTASPFYVGARGNGFNFTGLIDEPAVYSQELTPDQVATVHRHCKSFSGAPVTFSLKVIITGHGMVTASLGRIACGSNCFDRYAPDASVTLTATPHAFGGVTFTGFSGDCTGLTCALTMTRDMVVRANFTSNFEPWANDSGATLDQDTPTVLTLTGGDPEGRPITFSIFTPPQHGTLSAVSGNHVTYTPDPGYTGFDQFQFQTHDGFFFSRPATFFMEIEAGETQTFIRTLNFGPSTTGGAQAIVTNTDGTHVLGRSVRFGSEDDVVVTKLSTTGARIWETRIQATTGQYVEGLIRTADGGYAVVAGTGTGVFKLFVVKLTATGAIEWQRIIGSNGGDDLLSGAIGEDATGNLYIAGTVEFQSDGRTAVWSAKLTSTGALVWQKVFDEPGGDESVTDLAIVGGGPTIVGDRRVGSGLPRGLVLRLNSDGQRVLARTLGIGNESLTKVVALTGGAYAVAGVNAGKPWVVRFTSTDAQLWNRQVQTPNGQFAQIDGATVIADGTLVFTGALNVLAPSPTKWAIGISVDAIASFQQQYGTNQFPAVVAATPDGGFAVTGSSNGTFGSDTILIKMLSSGVAGCGFSGPTSFTLTGPSVTIATLTTDTADTSLAVSNAGTATVASVTSNITQICPVP